MNFKKLYSDNSIRVAYKLFWWLTAIFSVLFITQFFLKGFEYYRPISESILLACSGVGVWIIIAISINGKFEGGNVEGNDSFNQQYDFQRGNYKSTGYSPPKGKQYRIKNTNKLAQEGFELVRSFLAGRLEEGPKAGLVLSEALHNIPADNSQVKHNLTGEGILYFCELFPKYDYLNKFVEVERSEDN